MDRQIDRDTMIGIAATNTQTKTKRQIVGYTDTNTDSWTTTGLENSTVFIVFASKLNIWFDQLEAIRYVLR